MKYQVHFHEKVKHKFVTKTLKVSDGRNTDDLKIIYYFLRYILKNELYLICTFQIIIEMYNSSIAHISVHNKLFLANALLTSITFEIRL